MTDWLGDRRTSAEKPVAVDNQESGPYIQEMYDLASGDPATQAEIYADARAAARLTPDTASQLRYALILATPGHASTNAEEAQMMLREILAQPELLTPVERSLATIYLRDVETRLVLNAEARRLRAEAERLASSENAAITQRISTVEAENQQLRQALAEAEQKLEAIATIERSIREQTDPTNTP
ncbi:MAG TPA: hypothetical protein VF389_07590 [Woeseiaceae bacterium]